MKHATELFEMKDGQPSDARLHAEILGDEFDTKAALWSADQAVAQGIDRPMAEIIYGLR